MFHPDTTWLITHHLHCWTTSERLWMKLKFNIGVAQFALDIIKLVGYIMFIKQLINNFYGLLDSQNDVSNYAS